MNIRRLPLILLAPLATLHAADLKLAAVFSDHMVLQRGMAVPVWGWADPGEKVTVTFADQQASAVTDKDGRWTTKLPALTANATPNDLSVTGRNTIRITDVLVGDVWLGSGQSNMEFAMRDVLNAQEEIAAADKPAIRLFTVPRCEKAQIVDDVNAKWVTCSPDSVTGFSAVLYLFGREIQPVAGVPIGLIHSSVGGTRIELWTAPEGLAMVPEFADKVKGIADTEKFYREQILPRSLPVMEDWIARSRKALASGALVPVAPDWPNHPGLEFTGLYRGMIYPIVPFAMRGVVWYQGEWNGGENEIYVKRMQALISGWRAVWGIADLPFYYVQLARMPQKDCQPWQGDGLAPTREAQRKCLAIPHTGMATIIDLEGDSGWHPRNKQDVAKRLSRWAMHNEYGKKNLVVSGPLYKDMSVEGSHIRLRFDSVGAGLVCGTKSGPDPVKLTPDQPLRNFAVAGADKRWVNATAEIAGNDVLVSSPEVATPVAVRYAYCQDPVGCSFYNKDGLPASPFRTDDW